MREGSFTFIAFLVSELQAGGVFDNGLVHHHVALVVVVVLQVDRAVDLVELLCSVVDVSHLTVRLADQDCQEIISPGHNLYDCVKSLIDFDFNVDKLADLCPNVSDAVQGQVVARVEVLGEGDVGEVCRGSHVLILLTSLHRAAGADDIILELRPGTEAVRRGPELVAV